MVRKCYPNGKKKAFVLTYDDGVLQDVRLVLLLNRYGLKGTFNLNSLLMEREFVWHHEKIGAVRRLPLSVAAHLYEGHEVASHSCTHPDLQGMSRDGLLYELGHDKYLLEQLVKQPVLGFGVPFDYYDDVVADVARQLGFRYARGSEETCSYAPNADAFHQNAGMFHLSEGLEQFVEGFFTADEELASCIIVGHSYDLDAEQLWETMESMFARVAADENVLSMTHLEYVEYLQAMEQAEMYGKTIINRSDRPLWFEIDGKICRVDPQRG
ncbi:MAG: polysaccharide deacetylase family protein [Oscillospiraceae bacterium]|nr:polysaccharide deacetylase family protein [Oscillospiraceae bacterium]